MKVVFSYTLIIAFIIIALPKTVFHNHYEHDHHKVDNDRELFSQDHESCFSCSFDYSSLSVNVDLPLSAEFIFLNRYVDLAILDLCSTYIYDVKSRGSPNADLV